MPLKNMKTLITKLNVRKDENSFMETKNLALSFQWHITSNCLNRCKHCYMFDENYVAEDCTYDDFCLMLSNIEDFCHKYFVEVSYFTLTGGSPFMNPDCEKILKLLHLKSKFITLLDIPEMVNDKNIELMHSYNIKNYQVSLDGLKETHDSIRGKGSFDKTIEACKKLYNAKIRPTIMFTLSKDNYYQLISLCEYLVKNLDEFSFSYDFVVPIGNAGHVKNYISTEQVKGILDEYYVFSQKNSNEKQHFSLKPSEYRVYKYSKNNEPIKTVYQYPMISGCHIGWDGVSVLQNGDVLPCRRLPIVIGNLKKDSFEDIFLKSDLLRKFRRYPQYLEQCGTCQYGAACRGCPAISYGLTGDCFKPFELCTHKPTSEYFPKYKAPDLDCSNEEEMKFIESSMRYFALLNQEKLFTMFPNIIKIFRRLKKCKSKEDRLFILSQHEDSLGIDEIFILEQLMGIPLNDI